MNTVQLPEIATIIMGQSPPSTSYNTFGQGLPFFQGKTDFGDLYPRVRMFCSAPNKITEKGDILLSVRAPVGPTNVSTERACIGRGLAAIRASSKVDPWYLLYFLRFYEPQFAAASKGSTFDAITREDVDRLQVPLPPLPEQSRIAGILSRADRLRRLRRYALEMSDGYLQSVFLEMFGDPARNPMGWETDRLRKLCAKVVDCLHSTPNHTRLKTPYPCIRSSDIQNGRLDWSTTLYVDSEQYALRVERLVPRPSDVVYCREGARLGNSAIIPKRTTLCLGQRMMLFRANPEVATPEFIWAMLGSRAIGQQVSATTGGSASPHINIQEINTFQVVVPPLTRQKEYSRVVQDYERLRTQKQEALRQAEHLFQTLLHQAFR